MRCTRRSSRYRSFRSGELGVEAVEKVGFDNLAAIGEKSGLTRRITFDDRHPGKG